MTPSKRSKGERRLIVTALILVLAFTELTGVVSRESIGFIKIAVAGQPSTSLLSALDSQMVFREIYIRADGSIEDLAANFEPHQTTIQRDGDVYTFEGDIHGCIIIEASNIVLNGGGYALQARDKSRGKPAVQISNRENVTLTNLQTVGFKQGVELAGSNNIVSEVIIKGSTVDYSGALYITGFNNNVTGSSIIANEGYGLYMEYADHTLLSDNIIADNGQEGIYFLMNCTKTVLRRNVLNNNFGGAFKNLERSVPSSSDDIDSSNLVDGRSVCYWFNERDKIVPSEAGYVFLDHCTNITVRDISIPDDSSGGMHNSNGIYLYSTTDSLITNNYLGGGAGIRINGGSRNVSVTWNNVSCGIFLGTSGTVSNVSIIENCLMNAGISLGDDVYRGGLADVNVVGNSISECATAVALSGCNASSFSGNNITGCNIGVYIFYSHNNVFFHNNFINNTKNVLEEHYNPHPITIADLYPVYSVNNTWDVGAYSGGNYWSDYGGSDGDGNGIGDSYYSVCENMTDHHPLMKPFNGSDFSQHEGPASSATLFRAYVISAVIATVVCAVLLVYYTKSRKRRAT
jgi:parallel beta-helix repeat protein